MWVWKFSANYVLIPLRFNLNRNIWKPFLKSSPLDFSGQRLGNTSLVVFFRFHSFSLVVKWPEFARVYITNILSFWNFKLAQLTDVRTRFSSPWGSIPAGLRILRHMCCTSACILSSKTNDFGKECLAKSSTRLVWWSIATGANQIRHLRLDNRRCKPFDYPVLDNFLITWMKQEVIYEVWWVFYPGNMFLVDLYQETLGPGVSMGSYPFPFGIQIFLVYMRKPFFLVARDQVSIPSVNW